MESTNDPAIGRELDLLIRSTSSLLSLVNPQVSAGEDYCQDESRESQNAQSLLDRLALLFVTQPYGDVAATAAAVTAQDIPPFDVSTPYDSAIPKDTLYVTKNSTADRNTVAIPKDKWLKVFLTKGPPTPDHHVAQVEYLVGELRNKPDDPEPRKNLKRYIYLQCIQKIKRRFHSAIPESPKSQICQLFIEGITGAEISSQFLPTLPSNRPKDALLGNDETWLHQAIISMKNFPETDKISLVVQEGVQSEGSTVKHLKVEPVSMKGLFHYVRWILTSVMDKISTIDSFRKTRGQTEPEDVLKSLDKLIEKVGLLARLVYHSPAFWYLLGNPAIRQAYEIKQVQPLNHNVAEVDEVDEVDEKDEDDEGPDPHSHDVRDALRHWLKCFCHWSTILHETTTGSFHKFILSRPLKIELIKLTETPKLEEQASLKEVALLLTEPDATLETIAKTRDALCEVLKGRAQERLRRQHNAKRVDEFLGLSSDQQDEEWRKMFTGRPHCESILAWCTEVASAKEHVYYYSKPDVAKTLLPPSKCYNYIGVSKRCCYACHLFLKVLNPNLKHGACHGMVYPWAMPSTDVSVDVKRAVLNDLKDKLNQYLRETSKGGQCVESGSGPSTLNVDKQSRDPAEGEDSDTSIEPKYD